MPEATEKWWEADQQPQVPLATETPEEPLPESPAKWWAGEVVEPAPSASIGDRATAFGQGVVAGGTEFGPIVAGAVMGGRIGALGGPVGAGVGAIVGAGAGALAGQSIRENAARVNVPGTDTPLTFESAAAVPYELRPWFVGGETFGASMAFAAAPYTMISRGPGGAVQPVFAENLPGRVLNSMVFSAASRPAQFAVAETSMAIGASMGAGAAEEFAPGNVLIRAGGEIAGGFANPGRFIMLGTRVAIRSGRNFLRAVSPAAREDAAARFVIETIQEFGEDPDEMIAILRSRPDLLANVPLTAGQATGSRALLALEKKLASESARFGADARRSAEQALDALRVTVQALENTGDPAALRAAAAMREKHFEALLQARLSDAENKVLEAAAQINPGDNVSLRDFGLRAGKVLDEALQEVRRVERELWGQVDRDAPARLDNVFERFDAIKAEERLPNESLPAVVEGFIRIKRGQGGDPELAEALTEARKLFGDVEPVPGESTTGELILFRSRMLALSREAAAKSEWSDARVYGALAEAALDDLEAVGLVGDSAYDAARAWSRELHETFSQTYAGTATAVSREGGERVPPEMILRRAFGSGREMGELQLRQLREASRMAGQEHFSRMQFLQEQTLRRAVGRLVGVGDNAGRVHPDQLAKWRRDNKELLEQFPEISRELETVESAERFFRKTQSEAAYAQQRIREKAAFSRLLRGEDPATTIGRMIRGENPVFDLKMLARFARGNREAEAGLRRSVWEWTYARAVRQGGDFSFGTYRQTLEGPVTPGGPPLSEVLVEAGIMSRKDMDRALEVVARASEIEEALANPETLDKALSTGEAIADFTYRIIGARMAAILPTGGAHSLIVGGAGSRFARQALDRMPSRKTRDIIIEASTNPDMMATLLERPKTFKDRFRVGLQMHAYMWQAGIGGWAENAQRAFPSEQERTGMEPIQ